MLKFLRIQNFILISECEIEFDAGFSVLSGETGAGKSAVIRALKLLFGDRGDSALIREGHSKACVEGAFDVSQLSDVTDVLEEAGVAPDEGELLLIRRDLGSSSRCYVNSKMVPRTLLKQIGARLIDFVGQHANQRLMALDYHREAVDLFANLSAQRAEFAQEYHRVRGLEAELKRLTEGEASRLREIERCRMELEELNDAGLKEGEDEALFAEYSRLSHSEELCRQLDEVTAFFEGDGQAKLNKNALTLDRLSSIDPDLKDLAKGMQSVAIELEEVGFEVIRYRRALDLDPRRLATLDDRLKLISQLKRKYGGTFAEIEAYRRGLEERLDELEGADLRIEAAAKELSHKKQELDQLGADLTEARKQGAVKLQEAILENLRPLNMKGASFEIRVVPQDRTQNGDDLIEFFFAPNPGEKVVSVRQSASGGELSRVLLALKTALAGLEMTPTLVFDEVDANIGGQTAVLVGEKLATIAQERQVLCITHLPQVAKQADHHYRIAKETVEGRTYSSVTKLQDEESESELVRMMGLDFRQSDKIGM